MQSELCAVCPAVYIQCAAEYAVCVFGVLHMMFAWCALCSVCRDCPAVYIHCFQCVFLLFSVECVRVQCGAQLHMPPCSAYSFCPAVKLLFPVCVFSVVHTVFALRWIPAGSLSADAHLHRGSGGWEGGIQTDMHTQTDR